MCEERPLYLGGLNRNYRVSEIKTHVEALFAACKVKEVYVPFHQFQTRERRYCFVTIENAAGAQKALAELSASRGFDGRPVKVRFMNEGLLGNPKAEVKHGETTHEAKDATVALCASLKMRRIGR